MVDGTEGGEEPQPLVNTREERAMPNFRLSLLPNEDHVSEIYDDRSLEYSSFILRSLEKHLPTEMLTANRFQKYSFMSKILRKYISREELTLAKSRMEYRQNIISNYQPRFPELYDLNPVLFLHTSFWNAINENTEKSFRSVISEPSPGLFVFQMFNPSFCQKLLEEVENFRKWANKNNIEIKRPTTQSTPGVMLDDFGLDSMLNKLIKDFIFPLCKVFFPEVCEEAMFDSHHGFVIEYRDNSDVTDSGLHRDDSDITLNVCVSENYEGGKLCFRGRRCKEHWKTATKPEEIFDYCQSLGQAILHRGSLRNGAKATISGNWANMTLWCRNSLSREKETYLKECLEWCSQCAHEMEEKRSQILATKREGIFRIIESEPDAMNVDSDVDVVGDSGGEGQAAAVADAMNVDSDVDVVGDSGGEGQTAAEALRAQMSESSGSGSESNGSGSGITRRSVLSLGTGTESSGSGSPR